MPVYTVLVGTGARRRGGGADRRLPQDHPGAAEPGDARAGREGVRRRVLRGSRRRRAERRCTRSSARGSARGRRTARSPTCSRHSRPALLLIGGVTSAFSCGESGEDVRALWRASSPLPRSPSRRPQGPRTSATDCRSASPSRAVGRRPGVHELEPHAGRVPAHLPARPHRGRARRAAERPRDRRAVPREAREPREPGYLDDSLRRVPGHTSDGRTAHRRSSRSSAACPRPGVARASRRRSRRSGRAAGDDVCVNVRVRPGTTTVAPALCRGERLVGGSHAFAFDTRNPAEREPRLERVRLDDGRSTGVSVRVTGDAEIAGVRAVVQVQALCARSR